MKLTKERIKELRAEWSAYEAATSLEEHEVLCDMALSTLSERNDVTRSESVQRAVDLMEAEVRAKRFSVSGALRYVADAVIRERGEAARESILADALRPFALWADSMYTLRDDEKVCGIYVRHFREAAKVLHSRATSNRSSNEPVTIPPVPSCIFRSGCKHVQKCQGEDRCCGTRAPT